MITTDASALEAKYGKKPMPPPQGEPPPLFAPGMNIPPSKQGQIPQGTPIPEGTVIQQVVGRGQPMPSMMLVPPQAQQSNQPAIQVVPPHGAGRTTIGTFVEQAPQMRTAAEAATQFVDQVSQMRAAVPQISPTTSNPMTAAVPPINSGIAEPPAEPPKPKRKKVDLTQVLLDHIWELGGEKSEACQKFYDRSEQTIKQWQKNPAAIPLGAVIQCLGRRPGVMEMIAEELEPHFACNGREGTFTSLPNRGKTNVSVCAAILERPTLPFMWTCLYLAKKYELGFEVQADTMIVRSRNMLAHKFLQSGVTWSLWLDSDIAAPIANADWFRWITGSETINNDSARFDVLGRLLGHGKAIMGGVYASRRWHGALVIQPEIHPRNHEDKLLANDIRKGVANGLHDVNWVGFGCALVHREVFLEVQRRFPDLAPEAEFAPWRFFDTQGAMGEDEAFCQRVKACSIPIWLDSQLICGHVGQVAFLPEHTRPVPAF
jgi:hypothetical protein